MKNRLQVLSVCILCLVLLLAACSQEDTVTEPDAGPSQPAPGPAPTANPPTSTTSSSSGPSESAQMPETEWHLVVIGDSSLGGLPKAFASQIENDLGVQVVRHDSIIGGLSAGRVLRALQAEPPLSQSWDEELANDLRQAEVVVMFVNPVDSVDPERPLDLDGCFVNHAPASCSPETFEQYTADMKAIWAKILELRAGQPTILRATDIYNPLVSPWNEAGVFDACTECWENMSHAARLAAEAYNIPFLSRYDAFNGTNHDEDPREKGYIQADGEHPTELASEFTAELLSDVGYEPVSPPASVMAPSGAEELVPFPLSEPGPYYAGNREFTLVDESRNGREIELLIWYPAINQTNADGRSIVRDAVPDTSSAPYPLILTEENSGRYVFLSHLATHGFVMVVLRDPPVAEQGVYSSGFQNARDFLFSLDEISSNPPDGLESLIDTNRVGVTGYSYGGDISLMVSGARIDPDFYRSQCEQIASLVPELVQWVYNDFYCNDARNWDEFVDFMGEEITSSDSGLWQPLADERILAVMPMAPTVSWFYGARGLAAVDRPTFLIWGTEDEVYSIEAEYTFEHLTKSDRYLISFIGNTHFLPMTEYGALRLKHFAAAYFGYYLQGKTEYRDYFSKAFVSQFDDLAWGVYEGE